MNKKNLIIHAGHGKTGTSAIQSRLAIGQEKLKQLGIYYPINHLDEKLIANACTGGATGGNLQINLSKNLGDFVNGLASGDDYEQANTLLFSNEVVWRKMLISEDFQDSLKYWNHKYDLKIILVTRDIFDHLFSSYNQHLKNSFAIETFPQFLKSIKYTSVHDKFSKLLLKLDQLEINYELLNYTAHRRKISQEIFNAIGANVINSEDCKPPTSAVVNRSLSRSESQLIVAINRCKQKLNIDKKMTQSINRAIKIHADIKPSQAHFSPAEIELIQKMNRGAITIINDRLPEQHNLQANPPSEYVSDTEIKTNEEEIKVQEILIRAMLKQINMTQ